MSCKSCKSKDIAISETSGELTCSKCYTVQDFNNYSHHFGGVTGEEGTFIRLGTVAASTVYSYKERKLFKSDSIVNVITRRFVFTVAYTTEVKDMVEKVTASDFGLGNWFSVLVGVCSCIVMQANKPLPISEVADVVGCELYEMSISEDTVAGV